VSETLNGPFRAKVNRNFSPRLAAWADGTDLSGRNAKALKRRRKPTVRGPLARANMPGVPSTACMGMSGTSLEPNMGTQSRGHGTQAMFDSGPTVTACLAFQRTNSAYCCQMHKHLETWRECRRFARTKTNSYSRPASGWGEWPIPARLSVRESRQAPAPRRRREAPGSNALIAVDGPGRESQGV
jgi:hypothetical protein